jgi:hypothetical protein
MTTETRPLNLPARTQNFIPEKIGFGTTFMLSLGLGGYYAIKKSEKGGDVSWSEIVATTALFTVSFFGFARGYYHVKSLTKPHDEVKNIHHEVVRIRMKMDPNSIHIQPETNDEYIKQILNGIAKIEDVYNNTVENKKVEQKPTNNYEVKMLKIELESLKKQLQLKQDNADLDKQEIERLTNSNNELLIAMTMYEAKFKKLDDFFNEVAPDEHRVNEIKTMVMETTSNPTSKQTSALQTPKKNNTLNRIVSPEKEEF